MKLPWKRCPRRMCSIVSTIISLCLLPTISPAEVTDVGLRYGRSFGDTDFEQYDLSASLDLPWRKTYSSNWLLRTGLEGMASVLTWDGDTAFKPSLMTNLLLSSPGGRVDFIVGLGLGVMIGDTEFDDGDHDLGGPFFLQGQAGFRLGLTDNVFIGYRYFHQSNAEIYESNDSVNIHEVEIGWRF